MRASQIASITAASLLTAGVGYALYFDYRRQNDPNFRKQLKKESKKTSKAQKKDTEAHNKRVQEAIEEVLRQVNKPGELPADPALREKYFMESVTAGETLIALGPSQHLAAAAAFFKAIKVYPSPVELIMIYQKATPEPVFNIIMEMVGKDAELVGATGGGQAQNPLGALSGLAQSAPSAGETSNLDEVDDEPTRGTSSSTAAPGYNVSDPSGPSSQASSQEWDKPSGASLGASPPADNEGTQDTESGSSTIEATGVAEETQDSGTPATEETPSIGTVSEATSTASTVVVDDDAQGQSESTTEGKAAATAPASPFNFASGSYTPSPVFKDEDKVREEQADAATDEQ